MDDETNQNIEIYHQPPSEQIQENIGVFAQRGVDLGRFLPHESHLMMSSDMGSVNLNYLKGIIRSVGPARILPPMPKEDLPCVGGLVFVPIRDLTYSDAMGEIKAYIEKVGHRKVYISELAEELQIDMDLIEQILNDIRRSFGIDSYV